MGMTDLVRHDLTVTRSRQQAIQFLLRRRILQYRRRLRICGRSLRRGNALLLHDRLSLPFLNSFESNRRKSGCASRDKVIHARSDRIERERSVLTGSRLGNDFIVLNQKHFCAVEIGVIRDRSQRSRQLAVLQSDSIGTIVQLIEAIQRSFHFDFFEQYRSFSRKMLGHDLVQRDKSRRYRSGHHQRFAGGISGSGFDDDAVSHKSLSSRTDKRINTGCQAIDDEHAVRVGYR